ncbi:AsmA family protein [Rhizobiaceae bacterium n13]|uniref:AsmA family protein n=1 Tax=Ferirhizobium litorale TaxID=2927786 RepID=A0AAE3QCD5_9HYPH|nr:AsmA-like C-terminal region-containing protein [Fererhizobium litorale]MDI7863462.1 AsmA family protein [Fererhizobium litorale]MDI7922261.1 AsmA family protein [Fererhizobium litorale]
MTPMNGRFLRRMRKKIAQSAPNLGRRTGIALLLLLAAFIAFRAAAPLLISTNLVRTNLEDAVSQWTGHRAIIKGSPQLEFWPSPRITLNDLTIERPTPAGGEVLGHVESLSATFSLFKAWQGRPIFYDFHFVRPEFFIERDETGKLHWSDDGLLADAISQAGAAGNGQQRIPEELNVRIGEVTIDDGTLVIEDARHTEPFRINSISADIFWPHLGSGLRANLIARIRDKDVRLDFSTTQPLLLLSGSNADARGEFASAPLSGNFEGIANLASYAFLSGTAEINAPDVPALVAWSGLELPALAALNSASVTAEITTMDDNLRFNNLQFTIDDAHGSGVLDLGLTADGTPKATGTLAFDRLDVGAFLAAFSIKAPGAGDVPEKTIDTSFLRHMQLDLRLSARQAALGPFQIEDIGASVLIDARQAKFDIGDSAFEGGRLSGHLDVAEQDFDGSGNLQVSVRDANLADVFSRLQITGPLPSGTGSLDLSLRTEKPVWATGAHDISGTFRLFADDGSLQKFDATAFRQLATDKPFFYLRSANGGSFSYTSADVSAKFADGAAELTRARFVGPQQTLLLSGVIPYESGSIALAGLLDAGDPALADRYPPLNFFVGGSWPDPVISAVIYGPAQPAAN